MDNLYTYFSDSALYQQMLDSETQAEFEAIATEFERRGFDVRAIINNGSV